MSRFANTLIQTLVLDQNGEPPNYYECNPFSSHIMLRSKKVTQATGGGRINVLPVKWADEDALNRAVVRMYRRVVQDVGNKLHHEAALSYLRKKPDYLGPNAQVICKPEDAEKLAETWAFLTPTVYAMEYMGTDPRRSNYYFLLPSPEVLGVSPVHGDEHGLFVRESRRVVLACL